MRKLSAANESPKKCRVSAVWARTEPAQLFPRAGAASANAMPRGNIDPAVRAARAQNRHSYSRGQAPPQPTPCRVAISIQLCARRAHRTGTVIPAGRRRLSQRHAAWQYRSSCARGARTEPAQLFPRAGAAPTGAAPRVAIKFLKKGGTQCR